LGGQSKNSAEGVALVFEKRKKARMAGAEDEEETVGHEIRVHHHFTDGKPRQALTNLPNRSCL
jgi:hypothetical protein